MLVTYDQARKKVLDKYKNSRVVASYSVKNGYLFSIKPSAWKDEEMILDALFKVAGNGTVEEYSPVMDPEEFKEALRHRIE